jgi:hypothetical protein
MSSGHKFIYILIILIIVLPLLIWKGINMRKDIPFQEIVPLYKGVAVINAGNWYNDNLKISILLDGKIVQSSIYDDKGFCLFDNLENDTRYSIEIIRTDIKGKLLYKKLKTDASPTIGGSEYVVLVGASVGNAWKFQELPERIKTKNIVTGSRTVYDFDKSNAIDAICNLPIPVKAVIIKECAAYYPRDIASSNALIFKWVNQLKAKNIQPILATVVPVTKEHDQEHPGRLDSILKFNDAIRDYTGKEGIPLFDLEKALFISGDNRYLNPLYSQPDGLHLVNAGYRMLDDLFLDLLPILKK